MSNLLSDNQTVNHHLISEKRKQRLQQLEIKDATIEKSIKQLKTKFNRQDNQLFTNTKSKVEKGQNKIQINWGTRSQFQQQGQMSLDFQEEDFKRKKNKNQFDHQIQMDIMERKSVQNISGHNKTKNLKTLWGRSQKIVEDGIKQDSVSLTNNKSSPVIELLHPIKQNTSTTYMQRSNVSMAPSNNSSIKSNVSLKFNLDEYIQNCEKQKQDAREIQQKALKLKTKQKLQRQLVRKLKNELNSNRNIESKMSTVSDAQFSNKSLLQNKNLNNMGISSYSTFSNVDVDNPSNIKVENVELVNSMEGTKMLGNVAFAELSKGIDNDDDLGIEEEICMQVQNGSQINIEKQLKQQINELEIKFMKSQKELKQEKQVRQTFQKQKIQTDTKNVSINNKLQQLQKQIQSKNKKIKKLQDTLQEKINLIKVKDIKIQELCGEIKMKASLVQSFGFENSLQRSHSMNGGSQQNLAVQLHSTKKQLQLVKNVLTKLRDSKEQYFKQFLIDSVGIASSKSDKKQISQTENQNSQNENKQSGDLILEKKNLTQESIQFADSSSDDNFSIPSEALSQITSQNQELKQSVELLSSKLKNIQTQLQKVQGQKHSMVLTHSSLEQRIMLLQSQNLKVQEIKQSLSSQTKKLKNQLTESTRLGESLRLEKQRIKQESEQNIKNLMKIMQQQKNKEMAKKIEQIAIQLQQTLKSNEQQKEKLHKKLKAKQEQNNNNQLLNKQLQQQIKSNLELSFHLQSTINKQKIQIQKLQDSIDKIKDENDKYMDKSQLLQIQRNSLNQDQNKLKMDIIQLNNFIEQNNQCIIKYKLFIYNRNYQQIIQQQVQQKVQQQVQQKEQQKVQQHPNKSITLSSNKISPKLTEQLDPESIDPKQKPTFPQRRLIKVQQLQQKQKQIKQLKQQLKIKQLDIKNKIKLCQQYYQHKQYFKNHSIQYQQQINKLNSYHLSIESQNIHNKNVIQQLNQKEQQLIAILEQSKKEVELAHNVIEEQEQELSIARLQKQQLEQSNQNAQIQIDLLNKMTETLKSKLKQAQGLNNKQLKTNNNCSQSQIKNIEELEELKKLTDKILNLQKSLQTKSSQLQFQTKELFEQKQQLQKQKQKNEQNIQLHIQLDILEIQIKQLEKQKQVFIINYQEKQQQLSILTTKYQLSLAEIFKLNTQLSTLTTQTTNNNNNNDNNNNNNNNNSYNNEFISTLQQIFKTHINSYNKQFMDIIKYYLQHLSSKNIIKSNQIFKIQTQNMLNNIQKLILDRKTILQTHSEKYKEILNKEDDYESSQNPSLSSSPLFINKNSKNSNYSAKKKYKEKIVESADKNAEDNFSQSEKSEKSLSQKKSLLLSEDAGSAFSLSEADIDNKQSQDQQKIQSKKDFDSSIGFSKSSHSLNQQNKEDHQIPQVKQKQKIQQKALPKGKNKGRQRY